MFCLRYPTGVCVVGNDGVQSLRDNVTLPYRAANLSREGFVTASFKAVGC